MIPADEVSVTEIIQSLLTAEGITNAVAAHPEGVDKAKGWAVVWPRFAFSDGSAAEPDEDQQPEYQVNFYSLSGEGALVLMGRGKRAICSASPVPTPPSGRAWSFGRAFKFDHSVAIERDPADNPPLFVQAMIVRADTTPA